MARFFAEDGAVEVEMPVTMDTNSSSSVEETTAGALLIGKLECKYIEIETSITPALRNSNNRKGERS